MWRVVVLFTAFAAAAAAPVKLIIDTDAGFDVDDVGAIGVANALQDMGEVEIVAVGHTNAYVEGIGAVSTLMHYRGRDDVPLGAYKGPWAANPHAGKGDVVRYIPDLVQHYPAPVRNSTQVPTAVDTYRKVLAAQPDGSVTIASIGITTNMRDLVLSPPDAHSPLNGSELIAFKVREIVWMGGDYNFGCAQYSSDDWLGPDTGCHGSAKAAIDNWPASVKQVFTLVGGDVTHGGWLSGCRPYGDPFRQAFEDWFGKPGTGRSSWDPIAVTIAVRGAAGAFCKETDVGSAYMSVDEAGNSKWTQCGAPGCSNQSIIAYASDSSKGDVSFLLNELLCHPPGGFDAFNWTEAAGENCYGPRGDQPAHGATDMETPPSSSAGVMSLAQCQELCSKTPTCTAVTVSDAGNGRVNCFRKKDVALRFCDVGTQYTTYVRETWAYAGGFNCYPGHGGNDLEHPPASSCGTMTLAQCKAACQSTAGCSAVTWKGTDHDGVGPCFRKSDIDLAQCDTGTAYDTFLRFEAVA